MVPSAPVRLTSWEHQVALWAELCAGVHTWHTSAGVGRLAVRPLGVGTTRAEDVGDAC